MLRKIISGGQTGADQAALDAAIKLGIPHGGWIPKGRLTENGKLPGKYKLKEMPTKSYPKRTEQNVIDSDGTLIITHGKLTGGSKLTQKVAKKHDRPCIHINLDETLVFMAASEINSWIIEHGIKVLNVAGSRASKDPEIYKDAFYIVEGAVLLGLVKANTGDNINDYQVDEYLKKLPVPPKTVEDAVDRLISEMKLKDKTTIANMGMDELVTLEEYLGTWIKRVFGLWSGNAELIESCRSISETPVNNEDDASVIIIGALHKELRETHKMRVVK